MKTTLLLLIISIFTATSFANGEITTKSKEANTLANSEVVAVTLRYYNKDSKTHVFKVKMSGSTKEVEFGSSRTASVTIQGGSSECVIICECGEVKVKGGDHITIKDGCITVD